MDIIGAVNQLCRHSRQPHLHRVQIWFMYLTITVISISVTGSRGQNVTVGEALFQVEKRATVDCTFDVAPGEIILSVYWRASTSDVTSFPASGTIIQYTLSGGITVPDQAKYGERVNLTDSYSLVIYSVLQSDIDDNPRYWCQANVQGATDSDYRDVTKCVPKEPILLVECGSECEGGDVVVCEVNGFTPKEEFDINWMIGEVEEPSGNIAITPSGIFFNASSTITMKEGTNLYTCEPTGKAYKYAESGEYATGKDITVKPSVPTSRPSTEELSSTTFTPQPPTSEPPPPPPPPPPTYIIIIIVVVVVVVIIVLVIIIVIIIICHKKDGISQEPQLEESSVSKVKENEKTLSLNAIPNSSSSPSRIVEY